MGRAALLLHWQPLVPLLRQLPDTSSMPAGAAQRLQRCWDGRPRAERLPPVPRARACTHPSCILSLHCNQFLALIPVVFPFFSLRAGWPAAQAAGRRRRKNGRHGRTANSRRRFCPIFCCALCSRACRRPCSPSPALPACTAQRSTIRVPTLAPLPHSLACIAKPASRSTAESLGRLPPVIARAAPLLHCRWLVKRSTPVVLIDRKQVAAAPSCVPPYALPCNTTDKLQEGQEQQTRPCTQIQNTELHIALPKWVASQHGITCWPGSSARQTGRRPVRRRRQSCARRAALPTAGQGCRGGEEWLL